MSDLMLTAVITGIFAVVCGFWQAVTRGAIHFVWLFLLLAAIITGVWAR